MSSPTSSINSSGSLATVSAAAVPATSTPTTPTTTSAAQTFFSRYSPILAGVGALAAAGVAAYATPALATAVTSAISSASAAFTAPLTAQSEGKPSADVHSPFPTRKAISLDKANDIVIKLSEKIETALKYRDLFKAPRPIASVMEEMKKVHQVSSADFIAPDCINLCTDLLTEVVLSAAPQGLLAYDKDTLAAMQTDDIAAKKRLLHEKIAGLEPQKRLLFHHVTGLLRKVMNYREEGLKIREVKDMAPWVTELMMGCSWRIEDHERHSVVPKVIHVSEFILSRLIY